MHNFALITGASTGIGKVFALELAKQKDLNLILTARRANLLEEVKRQVEEIWSGQSLKCVVLPSDLSSYDERVKLIESCSTFNVSLLVNNAGFGSVTEFSKSNTEWELNMIALNCQALLHLTRYFGPIMAESFQKTTDRGKIINISSVASFQAMPYMATYAATKAFVTSFSLAVGREKGFSGVDILALCPGPTASDFHLVAGLKEKMTILPGMSAESVVQQALAASRNGKSLHVNGINNFIMSQFSRFFTKKFAATIVEYLLREQVGRKTKWASNIDKS